MPHGMEGAEAERLGTPDELRRLYEATPAMLHSIDAEGRLLMVSDRWLERLGYTRDAVIGRPSTDFLTAASRHHAEEHVLPRFFREGRCEDVSYQMVARSGALLDVEMTAVLERDAAGRILRSIAVMEDVTARLAAERALRDGEARYRLLADATSDVITQLDLGLVRRYVSPACRRVLGYEPEELTGATPIVLLHPEDRAAAAVLLAALAAGTVPGDGAMITHRLRHKDGRWVWIEAGMNLVRDAGGAPEHVICALRDVSERHRTAEELKLARAAAERAAVSKTEFVANMSHELRTPLTGILGIHDLLQRDPDLNLRHRRYLTLAREAGQSLMAIINDVLDYSKIEAGRLSLESVPFDLGTLVEASCEFVRPEAAKKSLLIEAHLPPGLTLLGDPARLRQVLLNLLANAVKFTAGGLVWVEAAHDPVAARLRLSVSDTGIGIASDQLGSIFERFRQADGSITRQYGGTGLGLAICKRLVELMGGTIEVRSVMGAGSTFTIEIPAPVVATAIAREPQPDPAAAPSRQVLLVEDNRLNQTIIAEMLRHQGHTVMVVENGLEAIEAATGATRFDIVLMDIQMPVLDGFSATRAIRDRQTTDPRPRTPIIGLTANASEQDRELCLQAGMDAWVAKPIDWSALFRLMHELVAARQATGAVPASAAASATLDRSALSALAVVIGAPRLAAMVQTFLAEVRDHEGKLPGMEEAEIIRVVHGWVSMAGHLGFVELGNAAAAVEQDLRLRQGSARVPELRRTILRALDAAESLELACAA